GDASPSVQANGPAAAPRLRRVLSLWDLIFYGIVLIQPIAPVPLFGVVQERSHGYVVDTILIAMFAMMITAFSYGRMAALYPSAGSAYTYVGRALNPHLGFMAGWAMLLDYLIIPLFCVVYGSLIVQRMILQVPYVVITACFAGGMTYLNVRGIRATARANQVLMTLMGVVLVAFIGLSVRYLVFHQGWGGVFSTLPFYNPREFDMREVLHAT